MHHRIYGVNEPARTLDYVFVGLSDRLFAILRAVKLEGKLSRVMTFAAHNPFMELHAVDFDRNQSDSMELAMESSVHH